MIDWARALNSLQASRLAGAPYPCALFCPGGPTSCAHQRRNRRLNQDGRCALSTMAPFVIFGCSRRRRPPKVRVAKCRQAGDRQRSRALRLVWAGKDK